MPAHIGERWRDIVGFDVLDGIGSTEMLQTFLSNRPGDIRYGSTGKPVPGYEARIVDEHGRELELDEIGELIVRGPSAGEGYWNQRAKSRRTFAGEWTYTGDKYRRDKEGYYYYCGRTDDMFKVSGMWVSPFDVEAALASHEAVLEAAVIGKEDADGLIKPKAFIVLRNGFAADDGLFEMLKMHVKEKPAPGNSHAGSSCAATFRAPPPARSSASSCAKRIAPRASAPARRSPAAPQGDRSSPAPPRAGDRSAGRGGRPARRRCRRGRGLRDGIAA